MNNKLNELQSAFDQALKNITESFEGLKAEIIRVDKPKFKTEKRVAKVGERILIVNAEHTKQLYENGDVGTVECFVAHGVKVKEWSRSIYNEEYEVIIEDLPQPRILINLCKPGDKLRYLGGHEGYRHLTKGKTYEVISKGRHGTDDVPILKIADDRYYYYDNSLVRPETAEYFERVFEIVDEIELSPNEQRSVLNERAKVFVESKKDHMGRIAKYGQGYLPEFIVKNNHVTCLLRGFISGRVLKVGRADCMSCDVFNADIGKAIALARALKIDVPGEFLNAVQPTEKVIGMVVYNPIHDSYANLIEAHDGSSKNAAYHSLYAIESNIIDDTNAIYGGAES